VWKDEDLAILSTLAGSIVEFLQSQLCDWPNVQNEVGAPANK
jgi:hypothetical protein